MKLHLGHYCILIGVVLFIFQVHIAFNPTLDWAFTPIKVYGVPLYLAHNYVEMVMLFFIGIGFSKSFQRDTKIIEGTIWLVFVLWAVLKAIEFSTSILFTFLGVLLLGFPLLLGFYSYRFYLRKKR